MLVTKPFSPQRRHVSHVEAACSADLLDAVAFRKALEFEQKRTERSQRRFVLMLIDCTSLAADVASQRLPLRIAEALIATTRDTDITGWHEQDSITGTIFTEIGPGDGRAITKALLDRLSNVLSGILDIDQIPQVHVSFHVFPDDWGNNHTKDSVLYPDNTTHPGSNGSLKFKRLMDIVLSLSALILLLPLFAVIAILIKLTSPGPVFFRQQRVGWCGRRFTFLKFRSMYVGNRQDIHEQFVRNLIRGDGQAPTTTNHAGPKSVYKIVNDPRVTRIGRFLRRTSLDELPQFINVLRGEMSLVGPRPPVPYEVKCYQPWHRRRLITVKPGITGLWQVKGRSRVGFDDMIRLDLQYARCWSIWLDLKILLQTPLAVIGGEGAY